MKRCLGNVRKELGWDTINYFTTFASSAKIVKSLYFYYLFGKLNPEPEKQGL